MAIALVALKFLNASRLLSLCGRSVNTDPPLPVRSPEPALDLGSQRTADAVSLEAPAISGAVFPGDAVDDDLDLFSGATGVLDGEIHRLPTRVWLKEKSHYEVAFGRGVYYNVVCHTTPFFEQ